MPKLTVAQYADETVRPDTTIETGVAFRVRKTRAGVQRQWRYRFTINGRRDELNLSASGSFREHLATDLRLLAEYKDLVRQGINPKRKRESQYRSDARRQRTFREMRGDLLKLSSYTELNVNRKYLSHEEGNAVLSLYIGTPICK